ncbi:MAG: hypothetical protein NZ927_06615 [Candidatus Calescibacterium sp.]|nr:hypothetical protein [Candidatus Calescibacterium sp.]MCX7734051.1 hypothetical protein [bacterium]MDW8087046.1 FIST N-terminal domain-containing protein [Candidatus Calescibacterium sp.]
MFFSSGFSYDPDPLKACQEAFEKALEKFDTRPKNKEILGMIFMSPKYDPQQVMEFFKDIDFIGLTTSGNISLSGEYKGERSGITVNIIDKRQVYCETFSASVMSRRPREIGNMIAERFKNPFNSSIILFACPFYDVSEILTGIGENSDIHVSGGIASSDRNRPIFIFENGSIGSYMIGGVFIEGVRTRHRIFQTCKIVGENFLITSAYENIIEEIEGIEAEDFIWGVSPIIEDPEAMESSWFIALPIDENQEIYKFIPVAEIHDGKIFLFEKIETGKIAKLAFLSRDFAKNSAESETNALPEDTDFCLFVNCVARSTMVGKNDVSTINKRKKSKSLKFEMSGFLSNGEIITLKKPTLLTYTGVLSLFSRMTIM